jgi:2-oxoglutarate ferredoxin oxidoreductase subunit gamma
METNLLIAGFGGQGVMLLGKLISSAACENSDKDVTFFPSYGAEQRGGTANCYVVIADEEIGTPMGDEMDDLIVMNGPSLERFLPALKPGGTLFINSSIVKGNISRDDVKVVAAPVTELALAMGNAKVLNIIMLGAYIGYTRVLPDEAVERSILQLLGKKADLIPLNKEAFAKGLAIGREALAAR